VEFWVAIAQIVSAIGVVAALFVSVFALRESRKSSAAAIRAANSYFRPILNIVQAESWDKGGDCGVFKARNVGAGPLLDLRVSSYGLTLSVPVSVMETMTRTEVTSILVVPQEKYKEFILMQGRKQIVFSYRDIYGQPFQNRVTFEYDGQQNKVVQQEYEGG